MSIKTCIFFTINAYYSLYLEGIFTFEYNAINFFLLLNREFCLQRCDWRITRNFFFNDYFQKYSAKQCDRDNFIKKKFYFFFSSYRIDWFSLTGFIRIVLISRYVNLLTYSCILALLFSVSWFLPMTYSEKKMYLRVFYVN